MDTNEDGLTLGQWLKAVDAHLLGVIGLTHRDLADFPSYDSWADGLTPVEGAYICAVEYSDMPEDLFWEAR
jgi:hypothetical protein